MESAGKSIYTVALSRRRGLTGQLLKLGLDASSPLTEMESVREAILRFLESAEAWSLFLGTRLGIVSGPLFLCVKAKGAIRSITFKRAKQFVSRRSFSSHLKLTNVVRFLTSRSCFGSVRLPKSSGMERGRWMTMACGLRTDDVATGKAYSKIKTVCQPGASSLFGVSVLYGHVAMLNNRLRKPMAGFSCSLQQTMRMCARRGPFTIDMTLCPNRKRVG
jgi:hypothetical protein